MTPQERLAALETVLGVSGIKAVARRLDELVRWYERDKDYLRERGLR